jgi:PAT family beta-lactamase induction signal transducer AmpG
MKALFNRRLLVTLLLGFSSGLPIALCTSTLQAWLTVSGVSLMTIGFATLIGQPYVYKFIWAPAFDRYLPPLLGRRRGWIMLLQVGIALTLVWMALLDPKTHLVLLATLALLLAFLSSSQDINIDAYRTDLLLPEERGFGAAMVSGGYRVAMLVSGGLALVLAQLYGWRDTYIVMAGLMIVQVLATWWGPEPIIAAKPPATLAKAIVEPFKEFFNREAAIAILIFVVIYKLNDALALSLGSTFLLRGIGFNLADVGAIYKTVGITSGLLGAFAGGLWMRRLGLYRSLMFFGILQGLSNLAFMVLAMTGKNYFILVSAVFMENFCGGLASVVFLTFIMSLCNLRYTATQFAGLSALAAIGRVFVGPVAALMVKHMGWTEFYFWTAVIGIPSLVLLWWIRPHVDGAQQSMLAGSTKETTA